MYNSCRDVIRDIIDYGGGANNQLSGCPAFTYDTFDYLPKVLRNDKEFIFEYFSDQVKIQEVFLVRY